MRRDLPSGTVTFLFTDVEGSTRLLNELGAEQYDRALAEHRRIVRDAFGRHGGVEVDTQGDAFFVAFPTAPGGVAAAEEVREALRPGRIRVRIGVHTGTPLLSSEGYIGPDIHRAARIAAAGHGGQVLVSSATAALVRTDALRDLGERRLKDLSAPERIYQLGEDEFPPLKSLHQTNLPVPATPFLGRDQEVREVTEMLIRDGVRLLTLTGPGGTGKTRLALQSAAAAADAFPGGVWWVPLAPLRDPDLVLPSAARALGATADLAEHIADRRLLLLFDNFEQVTDAAPGVSDLLARCPGLAVMVTSREALRLVGEHEYAVDPMRLPEAVELFMTRARAARHDFSGNGEVPQICQRLDNLPLAIELAAARVKLLTPRALLERLDQRLPLLASGARDLPERQRTLRAAIEWSHELLSEEEQRLFARLSVFRGGWTLRAAEQVADADLDVLQSLVDKSLLRMRDERFSMLETIREFASERLEASGDADEVRARHADYFVAFAEEAEPHVRRDELEWIDRLERERDNLRAALDRLEASADGGRLLHLAGTLWRFWYFKSHLLEGKRRLDAALAMTDDRPATARAKALSGAAVMAVNLGDPPATLRFAEQARAAYEALGDEWGAAYATMMIGNAQGEAGDVAAGQVTMEGAMRRFVVLRDRHYALIASTNLAWMTDELGDTKRAVELYRDNLRIARELGNRGLEAEALANLGLAARDRGQLDDATTQLREAVRLTHFIGHTADLVKDLARLASVVVRAGDGPTAARLLGASEALTEQLGAASVWWNDRRNAETLELLRAALDGGTLERALSQGKRLTIDEAVELALESTESTP